MEDPTTISVPSGAIKIRRRDPNDTPIITKLPIRPETLKPLTGDSFVETPWRDFVAIDRDFKNAPGEYKYQPIHGSNSIRLLELLPGDPSAIIRINLLTAALDTDIKYDALSYEWCLPVRRSFHDRDYEMRVLLHILCDGKQMSIMQNLHGVLLTLRHRSKSRIIWADGICINQEDKVEIPQQLMLMGKIYRQAETVLCWIGAEKQSTRTAFRLIANIATAFHVQISGTRESFIQSGAAIPEVIIEEELLDEVKGDAWPAIIDVFTRPYFGRIWVVQEVVLAQQATIICGTNQIPWSDFLNVSKFLATVVTKVHRRVEILPDHLGRGMKATNSAYHMKAEDIVNETDEMIEGFASKWNRVPGLGALRDAYTSDARSLALCLEQLQSHKVTNTKDRVYGMLGMITPTSSYAKNHPILPSYDKTVQQVYHEATEWAIRDLDSLRIFNLCETPSTNVTPNLPTWVADLAKGPAQCRGYDDASSQSSLMSMFSPYFSASFCGNILSVQAHIVDTVNVVRPPFTYGVKPIFMMQHFHEFAYLELLCPEYSIYPTGCSKLEAFWRTLISDTCLDILEGRPKVSKPPSGFDKHFMSYNAQEFISNWGLPLKLTGKERDLCELALSGAPFPLLQMFPEDVCNNVSVLALMDKQPFVRWMYRCVREGDKTQWAAQVNDRRWLCDGDYGRQYFYTENGWMGIGHPCHIMNMSDSHVSVAAGVAIKSGDVVAVLAGSDKVWTLRDDGTGVYTIVGQAYVYGLSEGTGFDAKNLPKMKTIRIK